MVAAYVANMLLEYRPVCLQIMSRLESRRGAYSEYKELDGIGHVPMDEDPAGFIDALVPFVQRVLRQSPSTNGVRAAAGQPYEPASASEAESGAALAIGAADADNVVAVDGIASRV